MDKVGCDLVYEHEIDIDVMTGSFKSCIKKDSIPLKQLIKTQEPAISLLTNQHISTERQSRFMRSTLLYIRKVIEKELNAKADAMRLVNNDALCSWVIHCHSSFLSSLVKVTVRLPADRNVECLCLSFIAELLLGEGTWVCKDPLAGYSSTFILSTDRSPSGRPLNLRDTMHSRLRDLLPPASTNAPRRIVLHAHWAPSSPHWESARGNMTGGSLLKVATLIAAKCAAQANPREGDDAAAPGDDAAAAGCPEDPSPAHEGPVPVPARLCPAPAALDSDGPWDFAAAAEIGLA